MSQPATPTPQPFLHQLVTCLQAPMVALSGQQGDLRGGAEGVFRHDRRILSELTVDIDAQPPEIVSHHQDDADAVWFVAVVRQLGDPIADPTVRLERRRQVTADQLIEHLSLVNVARQAITATVRVRLGVDFAAMDAVKHGDRPALAAPTATGADQVHWAGPVGSTTVTASQPAECTVDEQGRVSLLWRVSVPARERWSATLTVTASTDPPVVNTFGPAAHPWLDPVTVSGPPDLARLAQVGLADLAALSLADPQTPAEVFAAAGSPWFLTLFGRDSLWAARFTLPLGTDLALGTLRALARRQGKRHDPVTAEAPGKIPHELRSLPQRAVGSHLVYYGTVDATALWVCLLHDAWRWGLPAADVAGLLDPLQAALNWLFEHSDPDGDGFLEYLDVTGQGLANQGWKDSGDAIQFADGTIAAPPIALSEAQAYAYEAAVGGAALLAAFDRPGADRAREWAAQLRDRFRGTFWVSDERGAFPALALDGDKRPVAVASSNLGHLLGTGLLTAAEEAQVAARLAATDLDCGFGLRTLSGDAAGFNALGYHTGSVWPHDTAIAVRGLAQQGFAAAAASLAGGLLRAAPHFAHRLPELYAGTDARAGEPVLAYPAACRPQAWSAATAVVLLQAALGLRADVPAGTLSLHLAPEFADWLPLSVTGLRVAGHPLEITADGSGQVVVNTTAPLTVRTGPSSLPAPRIPVSRPEPAPERTG